jgi:hypothetical protein
VDAGGVGVGGAGSADGARPAPAPRANGAQPGCGYGSGHGPGWRPASPPPATGQARGGDGAGGFRLFLRDWDPFASFHGWLGLLAAALFAAAAALGHRIEEGQSRAFDAHALLGMLALLLAAVTAVAGFVLLP